MDCNKEEILDLEQEIEELFEKYLTQDIYWETQIFKCPNRKNIKIKQPKYFSRKNPYLFTFQNLSHYFSIFELPDISFLDTIIMIPKFIESEHYFLNNLYLPKKNLLVFYLTPIKLYISHLSPQEIKKDINFNLMIAGERITWEDHFYTKFQNLFYTLNLIHQRKDLLQQNQIYKFIDSKDKLTEKEIQEMMDLHDFFLLKHPLNKI